MCSLLYSLKFLSCLPQMVATGQYMKYYWEKRERLYVPPSIRDPMLNSAYRNQNGRDRLSRNGYNRPTRIAELTAGTRRKTRRVYDYETASCSDTASYLTCTPPELVPSLLRPRARGRSLGRKDFGEAGCFRRAQEHSRHLHQRSRRTTWSPFDAW